MAASWAKRGKKCICIAPSHGTWHSAETGQSRPGPRPGDILTVRRVDHGYIAFEGIEGGFRGDCFRPLVERTLKQDLAIFRHMLDVTPKRAPAHI